MRSCKLMSLLFALMILFSVPKTDCFPTQKVISYTAAVFNGLIATAQLLDFIKVNFYEKKDLNDELSDLQDPEKLKELATESNKELLKKIGANQETFTSEELQQQEELMKKIAQQVDQSYKNVELASKILKSMGIALFAINTYIALKHAAYC